MCQEINRVEKLKCKVMKLLTGYVGVFLGHKKQKLKKEKVGEWVDRMAQWVLATKPDNLSSVLGAT